MLKLILLVLVSVAHGQNTDPCAVKPCNFGELCIKQGVSEFFCVAESELAAILSKNNIPIKAKAMPLNLKPTIVPNLNTQARVVSKPSMMLSQTNTRIVAKPQRIPQPEATTTTTTTMPTTTTTTKPDMNRLRKGNFITTKARLIPQPTGIATTNLMRTIQKARVLDANTFSTKDICKGLPSGDKVAHPFDNSQFIICSPPNGGIVMSCPSTLRFNKYTNRCDYTDTEPLPACLASPCKNNGTCTDLPNYEFKCTCPKGIEGDLCESTANPCSGNPCGPTGICKTFGFLSDNIQHYCLCDDTLTYGLDCATNRYTNPCLNDMHDDYYPVEFSSSVFVHCEDNVINFKACNPPLVWSQEIHGCDRPDDY